MWNGNSPLNNSQNISPSLGIFAQQRQHQSERFQNLVCLARSYSWPFEKKTKQNKKESNIKLEQEFFYKMKSEWSTKSIWK